MNRKNILIPAVLALSLLAGCNTIKGIGQDLEAGGRAISQASDEVVDAANRPSTTTTASCDPAGKELKGGSKLPRCK